jgi:hypothetical protein
MFFMVRTALETEEKKEYRVYANNPLLVKFWDLEHLRGTGNYTVCMFSNINYTGSPDWLLDVYYCNNSYRTVPVEMPNYGNSDATANMTGNVLLMHLDENKVVDSSTINNNYGIAQGGADTQANTGVPNLGREGSFDGTDDFVNFGSSDSLNFGTGNFSISLWFNTATATQSAFIEKAYDAYAYSGTGGPGWSLGIDDSGTGRVAFRMSGTQGGSLIRERTPPSTDYTDGTWHHVVASVGRGSNQFDWYVDGTYLETEDYSTQSGSVSCDYDLWLGANYNKGASIDRRYEGDMDEVALYTKKLNATEVSALYNLGNGYSHTGTENGLVSVWHMNESSWNIQDTSGVGNNGTAYKGVTYDADGKFETALSFDGVDDYVEVADDTSLNQNKTITVSAWIYPRNINVWGWKRIIEKNSWIKDGWTFYHSLFYDPELHVSIDGDDVNTNQVIAESQWQHVAFTYNSTHLNIYYNGAEVYSAQKEYTLYTTNPLTIGAANGGGDYFNGTIDEVAIWNRSLSATEIKKLYKRGVLKASKDTDNCVYLDSFDTTDLDTIYYSSRNSSYSKTCLGINNSKIGGINATDTYYIAFESGTTAGNYTVRYANGSSGTNVSFANTKVAWSSADDGVTWTQAEFTPDFWFSSVKSGDQFQLGVYVEDNLGNSYTNFSFHTDDIGDVNYPISKPSIAYYQSAGESKDYYLNGSHAGNMTINVNMAKDPDAQGTVNHSLYLYNPDGTYNRTYPLQIKG